MSFTEVIELAGRAIDAAGVAIIVIGALLALFFAITHGRRGDLPSGDVYVDFRRRLGRAILLGLEILVAADLVRTITSEPSLENVGVLAIIVVLRTVLSMSISIEIEGTLPWRRALTQSGGAVLAQAVANERSNGED